MCAGRVPSYTPSSASSKMWLCASSKTLLSGLGIWRRTGTCPARFVDVGDWPIDVGDWPSDVGVWPGGESLPPEVSNEREGEVTVTTLYMRALAAPVPSSSTVQWYRAERVVWGVPVGATAP